jgi:hypothetical protein
MKQRWIDVTVGEYVEIMELTREDFTPTEFTIERIGILTDECYLDIDDDELDALIMNYRWLNSSPSSNDKFTFKHLTFGEFIDIESYITTDSPILNLVKIAAKITKDEDIENQPIPKYYSMLDQYISYRTKLLDMYKGLFEEPDDEEDEEIEEDGPKPKEEKKSFGWIHTVYTLAKGDITKAKEITRLPHIMVLNWLTMDLQLKPKN